MGRLVQLLKEEFVTSVQYLPGKTWDLHKNPGSLHTFSNARGVIVSNGDLYVADVNPGMAVIHSDIIKAINNVDNLGLEARGDWHVDPRMYGVITVQQHQVSDEMCIGESNKIEKFNDNTKNWILSVFKKAKEKNPNIEFLYEKI